MFLSKISFSRICSLIISATCIKLVSCSSVILDLITSLNAISEKISVGITIHTEAVQSAQFLRSKLLFKVFRLAGHAPLPMRYSFEDDIL